MGLKKVDSRAIHVMILINHNRHPHHDHDHLHPDHHHPNHDHHHPRHPHHDHCILSEGWAYWAAPAGHLRRWSDLSYHGTGAPHSTIDDDHDNDNDNNNDNDDEKEEEKGTKRLNSKDSSIIHSQQS